MRCNITPLLLAVGVAALSAALTIELPSQPLPDGAAAVEGPAAPSSSEWSRAAPLGGSRGPRDARCRQVVQQEMRRYQDVVRRLNVRVSSLERDLHQINADRASQELTIRQLRGNLSEQERTLQAIVDEMQQRATAVDQRTGPAMAAPPADSSTAMEHARDCDQVYQGGGLRYAGEYVIAIQPSDDSSPFKVPCEAAAGAGWIIIQRRTNGEINFNRKWSEYKDGFGDLTGEFWLGNDKIHEISSSGSGEWTLRVEMVDLDGTPLWAEYGRFRVDNETQRYRVHVASYRGGTAGDSLLASRLGIDGARFSTYDRDHDAKPFENCADLFMGGWWYNDCRSHLNGEYAPRELLNSVFMNHGVVWSTPQQRRGLQSVKMMLRPTYGSTTAADAGDTPPFAAASASPSHGDRRTTATARGGA